MRQVVLTVEGVLPDRGIVAQEEFVDSCILPKGFLKLNVIKIGIKVFKLGASIDQAEEILKIGVFYCHEAFILNQP